MAGGKKSGGAQGQKGPPESLGNFWKQVWRKVGTRKGKSADFVRLIARTQSEKTTGWDVEKPKARSQKKGESKPREQSLF